MWTHNLHILRLFCSCRQIVWLCWEMHKASVNYMLTIEGIVIPVRSGCNCILFSDLNLTPHFQQWQYSNCFEKSWLSFWMISKYHHSPRPPHSTQHPVYLHWSAITNAFGSLNHGAYSELLHHCQAHCSFFQHGSWWTRSSVLCDQRDADWLWLDTHQFSNNIISYLI